MWDAFVGLFINVLLFIYQLVGNFGVAIILFTVLIRLVTHPLMARQIKGAAAMQELQKDKRWIDMQAKYKNDKEKLAQEQMKLYQELKINPFASCLPTLIQLPIIFALYQAVIRAMASAPIELLALTRQVYGNFLDVAQLIPLRSQFLWMDLGQPERLMIPGIPFGIPVLAVVVVISTYVQSKLMQTPATSGNDQTAMMSNMMNLYMPFLMGWMAYTLASGLALYFLISNLLGILQYAMLGKVNWNNLIPGRKNAPALAARAGTSQKVERSLAATTEKPGRNGKPEKAAVKVEKGTGKATDKQTGTAATAERTGKPGKLSKSSKQQPGGRNGNSQSETGE